MKFEIEIFLIHGHRQRIKEVLSIEVVAALLLVVNLVNGARVFPLHNVKFYEFHKIEEPVNEIG